MALAWLAARGVVALPAVAVAAPSRSTAHATLPVMASEAVDMACGEGALTCCCKSPALQSYSGMANPDSEADTVALFASLLAVLGYYTFTYFVDQLGLSLDLLSGLRFRCQYPPNIVVADV